MPDISSTGTFTGTTAGFEFLKVKRGDLSISFAGPTLPTTLELKYVDDAGNDQVLEGGNITSLPTSLNVGPLNSELKIVVTGGSPDFNVTAFTQ